MFAEKGVKVEYLVGTMIELPRACVAADQIAKHAEFFSFGTNDLTQTTLGMSRDDYGGFINYYRENDIIAERSVPDDRPGRRRRADEDRASKGGREARPDIKIGICGEHGGDPASVIFCHEIGLNYVSCSPFRVPIARLAAAQAAVAEGRRRQSSARQVLPVRMRTIEVRLPKLCRGTCAVCPTAAELGCLAGLRRAAFVLVVRGAAQFERGARRHPAFLHEAARALRQERVEVGGRAGRKFCFELLEHFDPAQAAAIDQAIGCLELRDFVGRVAVAAQADQVQARRSGRCCRRPSHTAERPARRGHSRRSSPAGRCGRTDAPPRRRRRTPGRRR